MGCTEGKGLPDHAPPAPQRLPQEGMRLRGSVQAAPQQWKLAGHYEAQDQVSVSKSLISVCSFSILLDMMIIGQALSAKDGITNVHIQQRPRNDILASTLTQEGRYHFYFLIQLTTEKAI